MTIIRAPRPTISFTIVDNSIINDERLSYRARGILISILSKPDHWRTTIPEIERHGKEGREAIRTAMRELRAAGYVVQTKMQDQRGRWTTVTFVYDSPQSDAKPYGFPTSGTLTAGMPDAIVSTENKNYPSSKPETASSSPPPSSSDGGRPSPLPGEEASAAASDVEKIVDSLAKSVGGRRGHVPKDLSRWRTSARALLGEGAQLEDVLAVIAWLPRSEFWSDKIATMADLRRNFPKLLMQSRHKPRVADGNRAHWRSGKGFGIPEVLGSAHPPIQPDR